MPLTNLWLEVNFGAGYAGASNVGYRLYKDDGTDSVARTETGVIEVTASTGNFGAVVPTVPDDAVGVEWDINGGAIPRATEDLKLYFETVLGGGGDLIVPVDVTIDTSEIDVAIELESEISVEVEVD